jgi:hypothetical protein
MSVPDYGERCMNIPIVLRHSLKTEKKEIDRIKLKHYCIYIDRHLEEMERRGHNIDEINRLRNLVTEKFVLNQKELNTKLNVKKAIMYELKVVKKIIKVY